MGQIQVYIPKEGQAVAVPSRKAVLWSETLDWHVHCLNENVKKVRIEFGTHEKYGDLLPMFKGKKREDGSPDPEHHVIEKAISDEGNGTETRTCNIHARVPCFQDDESEEQHENKVNSRRRRDKYSIVGLDKDGEPIEDTRLDPEIITTDPGGD